MDSNDIAESIAYSQINPWGEERADLRAGIISSVLANVHRSSNSKPYEPKDFMPDFNSEPERKSEKLQKQILEAFNLGDNR